MPVRLIIDTDGGVDDAVALWYALTAPEVEVLAITVVHGNVPLDVAGVNVCRILEAVGRPDIPVALGAEVAFGPMPALRPAEFIHGADGLGNTFRPRASFGPSTERAVDVLRGATTSDVVVVTLGPLTNLAVLLAHDPDWAAVPERLVVMGGAVLGAGNALPAGEANIAHDPLAAGVVASARWRRPPLLVGLDVTHRATFTAEEFTLLGEHRNAAAAFLDEPLALYRRFGATFCAPGEVPCHDLVAVMAAVLPGLVHGPVLPMAVQCEPGPAWGTTVVDRRAPFFERSGTESRQAVPEGFAPWEIGFEVDVERFRREARSLFGG